MDAVVGEDEGGEPLRLGERAQLTYIRLVFHVGNPGRAQLDYIRLVLHFRNPGRAQLDYIRLVFHVRKFRLYMICFRNLGRA